MHLDLGSGDGRGPYRWAAREPSRLFIASDANADGLLEIAWRAARKPARGGIANLLCIAEPFDVLARELGRIAHQVSVILPWGSLLSAVAAPEINSLCSIAELCLPAANIEAVFSYDCQRDGRAPGLVAVLDERHIEEDLKPLYREAYLPIAAATRIPQRELARYETSWAKRLAAGRAREVWRIQARYRP
ncbi:MAG: hypothetical protein L0Z53_09140 [Acidobacteriales bacterium]|nr:hypothetical protein [Terriglobales bacterium]